MQKSNAIGSKINYSTLIITSMFIVFTTNSCRKTKIVEVEKDVIVRDSIKTSWYEFKQLSYGNNFQKIIGTKFYGHSLVLFYSPDFSFVYDSLTKQWSSYPTPNYSYCDPLVRIPQINKNICFSTSVIGGQFSVFLPYKNSVTSGIGQSYSQYFSIIDTSFSSIIFNNGGDGWFNSSSAILSDSDRVMIPVRSKQNNYEYYVFDINPNNNINYGVQNFNKVSYPNSNGIYVIGTFGNRFLFQNPIAGSPSLMRSNFTVKNLNMPSVIFNNPFVFENKIYCTDLNSSNMYVSTNLGETWSVVYLNVPIKMKYFIINNKLVAILLDKLYDVNMSPNSIEYKELKNDGFENNKISSIFLSNNIIFISTTKGIYTKDLNKFYDYK